jgi:hypothetical protein
MIGKNEWALPALMPRVSLPPQWRRRRMAAAVFPFGIVLNLVFFGLVAVATTGIFYGIGFSLLEHREEIAKLDTDRSKADPLLREISPQWHSDAPPDDREAGSGKGESEISAPAPEISVAEWGTGYSLKDAQKQMWCMVVRFSYG